MVLASSSDGGTDGMVGVISLICIGVGATATVALTAAEEADLNKGIPPAAAKVQYLFTCDEGVGTTLVDRGSVGGNATLDSACTWSYGKCKQACISMDGINDYVVSASGVNTGGAITAVWVGKAKSTYNATSRNGTIMQTRVDNNNRIFFYYNSAADSLQWIHIGSGTDKRVSYTSKPAIDDYLILMGSKDSSGNLSFYMNGVSVGIATGAGNIGVNAAAAYYGADDLGADIDVSKPLFLSIIEGVFSAAQAKSFSRTLDQVLGLGIGV
jgi:hypothetical protein